MRIITAPTHYHKNSKKSVFLAGGISGCPLWQDDVMFALEGYDIDVLNPRRYNFDVSDVRMEEEQIQWEFDMLARADEILFWFPKETLCPITLYELGFQMGKRRGDYTDTKVYIGVEPGYARLKDIQHQTKLAGWTGKIEHSLVALVDELTMRLPRVK